MLKDLGISENLENMAMQVEEEIKEQFNQMAKISEKNNINLTASFFAFSWYIRCLFICFSY